MNVPASTKDLFKNGKLQTGGDAAARLRRGKNVETAGQMDGPFLNLSPGNNQLFVYGQDQAAVPEDALWLFNIMSAETGYGYWYKKKLTVKSENIWSDNPVDPERLPETEEYTEDELRKLKINNQPEWDPFYRWQLVTINTDPVISVIFHGTQLYTRRLSEKLIDAAADRLEDTSLIMPICRLYNEPYDTQAASNINSIQAEVMGWADPQNTDPKSFEWVGDVPKLEAPAKKGNGTKRTRRRRAA